MLKPSQRETAEAVCEQVHALELAGRGAAALALLQGAIQRCVHPVHKLVECRNDLQRRLLALTALDTGASLQSAAGPQ